MSSRWSTIESDPAVFSELIDRFGVPNVGCEEIFALDMLGELAERNGELYGLIFLFKYTAEVDRRPLSTDANTEDLFFARQVVQNACATQAILGVLMNAEGLDIGEQLGELKAFTQSLDPESKGLAIGNYDPVRLAHNAFARADPFYHDDDDDKKKRRSGETEDAFHFIAYIPFRGCIYEVDGLKAGPIKLGDMGSEPWWAVARPAIEERISRYTASENSFTLLGVCQQRSHVLEREAERVMQALASAAGAADEAELQGSLGRIHAELADEKDRLELQRQENVRRRHNFTPFIIALLQALAAKGNSIPDLVDKANERKRARGTN